MNGLIRKLLRVSYWFVLCSLIPVWNNSTAHAQVESKLDKLQFFENIVEIGDSHYVSKSFEESLIFYDSVLSYPDIRHFKGLYWEVKLKYLNNLYAIPRFTELINFAKNALQEHPPDTIRSQLIKDIGSSYMWISHYDSAIVYIEKGYPKKKGGTYNYRMARCYLGLGEFEAALDFYKLAHIHYGELDFLNLEIIPSDVALERGELQKSDSIISTRLKRMSAYQDAQAKGTVNMFLLIKGAIQTKNGRMDSAKYYFTNALEGIKANTKQDTTAYYLWLPYLGDYYKEIGKPKKAIAIYERSKSDAARWDMIENHVFMKVQNSIAESNIQLGNLEKALTNIDEAIRMNSVGWEPHAYFRLPNLRSIRNYYQLVSSIRIRGQIYTEFYKDMAQIDDLIFSLKNYQLCDTLIDRIRTSYFNHKDKLNLIEDTRGIYEEAFEVARLLHERTGENKYLDLAFHFSEKSKSAILREAHLDQKTRDLGMWPDSLRRTAYDLTNAINYFQSELMNAREETKEVRDSIRLTLLKKKAERHQFMRMVRLNYPEIYRAKYNNETITPAEVSSSLDEDEAVIEYFLTSETSYAFIITRAGMELVEIEIDELDSHIQGIFSAMDPSIITRDPKKSWELFTKSSAELYRQLFSDLQPHIPEMVTSIAIVPDGEMSYIPFEMLITDRPEKYTEFRDLPYLFRKYNLHYGYTATLLSRSEDGSRRKASNYLGIAPKFSDNYSFNGQQLNPLFWNTYEVKGIADYLTGDQYIDEHASEQLLKNITCGYRVLHLSTHAILNDKDPLNSYFLLHPGDSLEDGKLHAFEIHNLDLNADMAVLSACNTGLGNHAQGEGIMSLGRAFSHAGCKSVIMSKWSVDDKVTSELMIEFYKYLSQGKSKPEALRLARESYLDSSSPITGNPFYWAGFVIYGDDAPVDVRRNNISANLGIAVGIVLLVILTVSLIKRKRSSTPELL